MQIHGLDRVKEVVLKQLAGKPAKVYLFGSWARGEQKRTSDIDIAIDWKVSATTLQRELTTIRDALEESTVPYKVDILNMNEADPVIISKILREGEIWKDVTSE
jgi:predicted nucleotidyltransferase